MKSEMCFVNDVHVESNIRQPYIQYKSFFKIGPNPDSNSKRMMVEDEILHNACVKWN